MIHFFPTFSKDVSDSPFAQELRALGIAHKIISDKVVLQYKSRIWLLFLGWPRVIIFAMKSAIRSLLLSTPKPDVVVLGSHIEVIIFGILRKILLQNKLKIVLLGFIMTSRQSDLSNKLRYHYFKFIFSIANKAICHSKLEVARYSETFKNSKTLFTYIPYGLHISGRENNLNRTVDSQYILTAGRSGRDYKTLFEAVRNLPIELHVICDNNHVLLDMDVPKNVTILRDCYGDDYVNELRHAQFVVIPLGVSDISAGQMVLIQAMAFSKATIITRTPTVEEYVTDHQQSLLVNQGSVSEMASAINTLLNDKALLKTLGKNAVISFEKNFCMKAYIKNLVQSVS